MIGKSLAHYEITGLLGKGGMGEVYRAHDNKLGRDVAIKILPAELSADPERIARFEREARTLASLQHPNVASIYGFEDVDGVRFLVMELVQGRDLSVRLAEGGIPTDEVIRIARQIAAGLEAAHERGIIHRDLKPANVVVNDAGEAKILDFGLARAWYGDLGVDDNPTTSPTITAAMTQSGTILGTAAYMSPEQARGRGVDRRADIWAFGAILWEMVTGQRLFEGETVSDTLAAVLRAEPDWTQLPVDDAPLLCRLIERCLVRDPQQRLRDIGEARILLQEGSADSSLLSFPAVSTVDTAEATSRGLRWPLVAAIAVVMLAVGAFAGRTLFNSAQEAPLLHTMIPAPPGAEFDMEGSSPGPAVLSPDGTMLVFSARGTDGIVSLYLRRLDSGESVQLSGTAEDAAYPFWSPDNRNIAYFAMNGGKLRKVAVAGGPPVTICPADNGKGGSWNEDGVILFAPTATGTIERVPSIGGEPESITRLATGENSHRHPRFLPNGRDFLYAARLGSGSLKICMGSLDGTEPVEVTESEAQAEFASGYLFTTREGVLSATAFDPSTGKLSGGRTPLVEQLLIAGEGAGAGSYSVLASGMMTFQTGNTSSENMLSWTDLESKVSVPIGSPGQLFCPEISPDGRRCVVEILGESPLGRDLWLVDLETGLRDRFTFDEGDENFARWTPDGSAIVYTAHQDTLYKVVERPVEGTGGVSVLYETTDEIATSSVPPDGSGVLIARTISDTSSVWNLEFIPFEGDHTPKLVLASEGYGGRYSPDGRWIAYGGRTAGQWEVFVMPAQGGRKWQITTTGAVWPQWQPDGKRLFVQAYGNKAVAYPVDTSGSSFGFGSPQELVDVGGLTGDGVPFDVHPDGKRILQAGPDPTRAGDEISPIHLVTDWRRALMR